MTLPDGIPAIDDYRHLLTTSLFSHMRKYADRFLVANRTALAPYARKWVKDPLHNWSRQWEYPYTFRTLRDHFAGRADSGPRRILDAGSGVTFFPHYISSMVDRSEVVCIDLDAAVERTFQAVVSEQGTSVRFSRGGLHRIPDDDDSFDAIYCISVLEHTDNYVEALRPDLFAIVDTACLDELVVRTFALTGREGTAQLAHRA